MSITSSYLSIGLFPGKTQEVKEAAREACLFGPSDSPTYGGDDDGFSPTSLSGAEESGGLQWSGESYSEAAG